MKAQNANTSTSTSTNMDSFVAAFDAASKLFADSRAASAFLASERRHQVDSLARNVLGMDATIREIVIDYIATIATTKGHAGRALASALNKTIEKIALGRASLARQ